MALPIFWSTWLSRARPDALRAILPSKIEIVGGELNAPTSTETTSYYARVLKDHVPLAIDILADF